MHAETDWGTTPELVRARRTLRSHGGDITIRDDHGHGDLDVEFIGACRGCPALAFTFSMVVHPVLAGLDGVRSVHSRQVTLSPALVRRVEVLQADASRRITATTEDEHR
jgi:Fe-S cluster biogenesis protein NfuA